MSEESLRKFAASRLDPNIIENYFDFETLDVITDVPKRGNRGSNGQQDRFGI